MTPKQQRIQRVRAGLCIDCGREVDRPMHYVRCAACREHLRRLKEERERGYSKASHGARVSDTHRLGACNRCAYATCNPGGPWFCPLPVCAREFTPEYREVEL